MPSFIAPLLLGWFFVVNLAAFFLMWFDKRCAIHHTWRIPEKSLFIPVLLGGGIGGILGMRICRHKTLHWYFAWGFPAILVAEIFLVIFIYCKFFV